MATGLRGGVGRGRVVRGWLGLAVVVLTGCSWSSQEPGLFPTPVPSVEPVPSTPAGTSAPEPTNPDLPVAGEAVWTTGDGTAVTVRFAVHAVRRTAAATVLDWSVTPLAGRGRPAGQLLPSGVDLGLGRALAGEQDLALLDVAGARAYRPLASTSPDQFSRCLCTPLYAVTPTLRFGETRLLQLSFPMLPDTLHFVDVALPNVGVVAHVPLTPVGTAPTGAGPPSDLARPAATVVPSTTARTYVVPGRTRRRETVRVDRVLAAPGITSVEWTLHSVDDQTGFSASLEGPPTARPLPVGTRVVNRSPADGPMLRVGGGPELGVRWTTAAFAGLPTYECLCSELDLWAKSLQQAGGTVHLASTLPGLPLGVGQVDVSLPGLPTFADVAVVRVPDGASRLGAPAAVDAGTWTYTATDPPRGWSTHEWPTPVPDPAQVGGYQSRTELLLDRLPRTP